MHAMPISPDHSPNVLVVGAGIAGERHTKAQIDLGSRVALYDIDPQKAAVKAASLSVSHAEDLTSAISASSLVYICTPDDLHTEIAAQVIRSGKDVFCEKPLTTNLGDALTLQQLVHQFGTQFIVGTYYRLTPNFTEAKRVVDAGEIGRPLSLEATYLHDMKPYEGITPWRLNQDFLYGGGIHPIDLAYWLAGEPVKQVFATTGFKLDQNHPSPEDYQIILGFLSGLKAHIWLNSRVQRPVHGTDLVVSGSRGTIQTHNQADSLQIFKTGDGAFSRQPIVNQFTVPIAARITNDYLQGQRTDHRPLPGIDEAIEVMQILDAAEKSIRSGLQISM